MAGGALRAQAIRQGASPDALVALIYGQREGRTRLPGPRCAGTVLDLAVQLQLVTTVRADPNGESQVNGFAPPHACGGFLQLLDAAICATSEVVRLE